MDFIFMIWTLLWIWPHSIYKIACNPLESETAEFTFVKYCPGNLHEWTKASDRKKCQEKTAPEENFLYHCVPTLSGSKLIEVCAPVRIIAFGRCATYSFQRERVEENWGKKCKIFSDNPCPVYYPSNEIYKYPGCYKKKKRTQSKHKQHGSRKNRHNNTQSAAVSVTESSKKDNRNRQPAINYRILIFSLTTICSIVVLLLGSILLCIWRRKGKRRGNASISCEEGINLLEDKEEGRNLLDDEEEESNLLEDEEGSILLEDEEEGSNLLEDEEENLLSSEDQMIQRIIGYPESTQISKSLAICEVQNARVIKIKRKRKKKVKRVELLKQPSQTSLRGTFFKLYSDKKITFEIFTAQFCRERMILVFQSRFPRKCRRIETDEEFNIIFRLSGTIEKRFQQFIRYYILYLKHNTGIMNRSTMVPSSYAFLYCLINFCGGGNFHSDIILQTQDRMLNASTN